MDSEDRIQAVDNQHGWPGERLAEGTAELDSRKGQSAAGVGTGQGSPPAQAPGAETPA